jgi:hypothetical protein
MANYDFAVKFDPAVDNQQTISRKILKSIILNELKFKKPVPMFIGGDSGEGKSWVAVVLEDILLDLQGMDLKEFIEDVNVFTPLEYPKKLQAILHDKRLKKINVICMHEARDIVKAKLWYSFINTTIADVNAMSRRVKPLCLIIISQFIRDIAADIRYTLKYYCTIKRMRSYQPPRLYFNVLWKDDYDIEKPRLKKRRLRGYLIYPNGRYRFYCPRYLEIPRPRKELTDIFDQKDYDSKAGIIKRKLSKLIKDMEAEIDPENKKINNIVEYYIKNREQISNFIKRHGKKIKVKEEFKEIHDLTAEEFKLFEKEYIKQIEEAGG